MRRKLPERWAERTVTRFLFLPKVINDEWRWLERATWVERLIAGPRLNGPDVWNAEYWVDAEAGA